MELNNHKTGIIGVVLALVMLFCAGFWHYQNTKLQSKVTNLQQEIAGKDKTIEVQNGAFQKLTVVTDNLRTELKGKNDELTAALEIVKKQKGQVLSATAASIQWRQAYEAEVFAKQEEIPDDHPEDGCQITRKKVTFEKEFGRFFVSGHTLTDPPQAWVSLKELRPLNLGITMSRQSDGSWKTTVVSSDKDVVVNIGPTAVDGSFFRPAWYEKIGVGLDAGVGTGFIFGVKATYRIGKVDVGPEVWYTGADRMIGVSANWHPFQRD